MSTTNIIISSLTSPFTYERVHVFLDANLYCDLFEIVGPLVGIEKQIKGGIDFIDPDDLGDYISGTCSCRSDRIFHVLLRVEESIKMVFIFLTLPFFTLGPSSNPSIPKQNLKTFRRHTAEPLHLVTRPALLTLMQSTIFQRTKRRRLEMRIRT